MTFLYTLIAVIVLFNVLHGPSKWPKDYFFKSRHPVTWKKKINPIWWLLNQDDPIWLAKNAKFWPGRPLWYRQVRWFVRNPTCNFDRYIIGFWDKTDWWGRERSKQTNRPQVDRERGEMFPLAGEKVCVCLPWISIYLPFRFEMYTGWKPNGEFGWISFRKR